LFASNKYVEGIGVRGKKWQNKKGEADEVPKQKD
jgi:hypothetical protein